MFAAKIVSTGSKRPEVVARAQSQPQIKGAQVDRRQVLLGLATAGSLLLGETNSAQAVQGYIPGEYGNVSSIHSIRKLPKTINCVSIGHPLPFSLYNP